MKIRKFNELGIKSFEILLNKYRELKQIDLYELSLLVANEQLSNELDGSHEVFSFTNNKKMTVAKTIAEGLTLDKNTYLYYDQGLWTWLSAYFLDILVPFKKGTKERDFRENSLYILEPNNWGRYYRHLLAFPSWIYSELNERGKIFLRGIIFDRGEIVEQLASVQGIQRNISIVEAATLLYYNSSRDDIHKGAASKNLGGTVRRFREVIQQFKLTFDLNSMNGSQIVGILPFEFDKWKMAS